MPSAADRIARSTLTAAARALRLPVGLLTSAPPELLSEVAGRLRARGERLRRRADGMIDAAVALEELALGALLEEVPHARR